jgi:hypothetical protein
MRQQQKGEASTHIYSLSCLCNVFAAISDSVDDEKSPDTPSPPAPRGVTFESPGVCGIQLKTAEPLALYPARKNRKKDTQVQRGVTA